MAQLKQTDQLRYIASTGRTSSWWWKSGCDLGLEAQSEAAYTLHYTAAGRQDAATVRRSAPSALGWQVQVVLSFTDRRAELRRLPERSCQGVHWGHSLDAHTQTHTRELYQWSIIELQRGEHNKADQFHMTLRATYGEMSLSDSVCSSSPPPSWPWNIEAVPLKAPTSITRCH